MNYEFFKKEIIEPGVVWYTPLIPDRSEFKASLLYYLHSEFQISKGYTKKERDKKKRQTNKKN